MLLIYHQVASFMDGRTSKQCRERWCHHLDPAVRKGGYTTEEDELIIFLQVWAHSGEGRAGGGGADGVYAAVSCLFCYVCVCTCPLSSRIPLFFNASC